MEKCCWQDDTQSLSTFEHFFSSCICRNIGIEFPLLSIRFPTVNHPVMLVMPTTLANATHSLSPSDQHVINLHLLLLLQRNDVDLFKSLSYEYPHGSLNLSLFFVCQDANTPCKFVAYSFSFPSHCCVFSACYLCEFPESAPRNWNGLANEPLEAPRANDSVTFSFGRPKVCLVFKKRAHACHSLRVVEGGSSFWGRYV